MGTLLVKAVLSGVIVVLISELAKRSAPAGALLASLPLTSILAFAWLYRDTGDARQVATLAHEIAWLVPPSLLLFLALPRLLGAGMPFVPALGIGCALTAAGYAALIFVRSLLGGLA
ncbi:MAG: DUF3147 family protein [Gammaproteobacteria bacterium]